MFKLHVYSVIINLVIKMRINYQKIGSRIAQRRKENKYTQAQLAEIIDVSKNHISNIENGSAASLDTFLKICVTLNITPDYLLMGTIRHDNKQDLMDLLNLCDDYEISLLTKMAEALIEERKYRNL